MELTPHTHWTNGGTGLTNFNPLDEPLYAAAIRAHGDPAFVISKTAIDNPANNTAQYSLHWLDVKSKKAASPFWRVFWELEKSMPLHS